MVHKMFDNNLHQLLLESGKMLYGDNYSIPYGNDEEVLWVEFCASCGDANANFHLSFCYITGNGVAKDFNKAIKCLELASSKISEAQLLLAVCCTFGIIVEKNSKKAFLLYKKLAENGSREAMCNLGICYFSGFGVDRNIELALDCFAIASHGGNYSGNKYAERIYSYYSKETLHTNTGLSPNINIYYNYIKNHRSENYLKGKSMDNKQIQEGWLNLLADAGIIQAQRAFIALYSAGMFHHIGCDIDYYDLDNKISKWKIYNDPFTNLVKGKMLIEKFWFPHRSWSDFENEQREKKCSEAISQLVKAADVGIFGAIPVLCNIGRKVKGRGVTIPSKFSVSSCGELAPYWENNVNCDNKDKIYKSDEPICFCGPDAEKICYIDYFSKQKERLIGEKTTYKYDSVVFDRLRPKSAKLLVKSCSVKM